MVGVKGRSGGRRYSKPESEKSLNKLCCRLTDDDETKIQQLAIAIYGDAESSKTKVMKAALDLAYKQLVLANVPDTTTQGTYADFRREFLNIYRPDINNPKIDHDYYVCDDLIRCFRKLSTDKKHHGVIVDQITNTFTDDLTSIHDYFLERKVYFDLPQIVAYGLKYFAEPADA